MVTIEIKNDSHQNVSWFVYNEADGIRTIALASGDLKEGKSTTYDPPSNSTDQYAVRITDLGGGAELQEDTVGKDATVTYDG